MSFRENESRISKDKKKIKSQSLKRKGSQASSNKTLGLYASIQSTKLKENSRLGKPPVKPHKKLQDAVRDSKPKSRDCE